MVANGNVMPVILEPRGGPSANAQAQVCGSEAVNITKVAVKCSSIPSRAFGTVSRAAGCPVAACWNSHDSTARPTKTPFQLRGRCDPTLRSARRALHLLMPGSADEPLKESYGDTRSSLPLQHGLLTLTRAALIRGHGHHDAGGSSAARGALVQAF